MKKQFLNERGQMLPFIAFMIVILLLFSAFSIATTMMFMQRKVVEDALDAAILSVTMASIEERHKPIYYYDYLVWHCTEYEYYTDKDGNEHKRCIAGEYHVEEGERYPKNYIYVKSDAESVLREFFLRNLQRNAPDAELQRLNLEIEYDDERFILVKKHRDFLDPPAEWNGWPLIGYSTNPDPWWLDEFSESTNFMGEPEDFTMEEREDRIVRFPRWVKLTATAEVDVPSVMGRMFTSDGNTTRVTVTVSAVRELIKVDRPVWSW